MAEERITGVTKFNSWIRGLLGAQNPKISTLWIEGEVSGWKLWNRGIVYFSIKDETSQLACYQFTGDGFRALPEEVRTLVAEGRIDGAKVQVQGEIELALKNGRYQFKVTRIRLKDDKGDLMRKFLELKERLLAEGLFKNAELSHEARRARLPFLPHRIGIVTASTGAVIHDMCDVITRRFPNMNIRLYPVKVQGTGAAAEIADGVRYFNACKDWRADVLIVGRGGGSIEDLWAFNEEVVVRAVAASEIPVISAVGHEPDVTLCDFAATVRAGTPSIAAEYAVPVKAELLLRISRASSSIRSILKSAGDETMAEIGRLELALAAAMKDSASGAKIRMVNLANALCSSLERTAAARALRLDNAAARLRPAVDAQRTRLCHRVEKAEEALAHLSPFNVLERGYSMTVKSDGSILRVADEVDAGETVVTKLANGEIRSVVA